MNPLDLNRLNVRAPYSVWSVCMGTYGFKTDYDILFRICFAEDQTIWQQGAYEFSILNESRKSSPSDKKVRDTIFCIVEEFFECNPDILLYQCETGDNRQAMRDRLFLRWFKEYKEADKYVIRVSKIVAEGVENYTAMIVQKDNPQREQVLSDFDNFVGFFQNKPQ